MIGFYEKIEDIPDDPERWEVKVRGKEKLSQILNERRDEALLYRNMSTLKTDVPLPDSLEDLAWSGANKSAVDRIVSLLEDPALLERTIRFAP